MRGEISVPNGVGFRIKGQGFGVWVLGFVVWGLYTTTCGTNFLVYTTTNWQFASSPVLRENNQNLGQTINF